DHADHEDRHHRHDRAGLLDAHQAGQPAPLEDRDDGAEGGHHRQQEAEGRLQRDQDRAEDHDQQEEGEADDQDQVGHERVVELLGHVDVHRRGAGDEDLGVGVGLQAGPGVADVVHQVLGGHGGRLGLGDDGDGGGVAGLVGGRRGHGHDVVEPLDLLAGALEGALRVVAALGGDDDHERAVEAGAEALGEQVVGAALGGGRGLGAVVGQAQFQGGGGHGGGAQADHAEQQHGHGPADDETCPAGAHVLAVGLAGGAASAEQPALLAGRPDPAAGVAEQRGDHGEGDQDRDGDRACGGDTHLGQHRDVDHGQADQGDEDGETGEDDRGARGADGPAGRLLAFAPLGEFGAVAGDDEQGVVDADREADHRGQDGRGGAEVEGDGQRGDGGDADADADQRGEQRQSGREQGAEGDDQDDRGDADADDLRGAGLRDGLEGVTTDLDGQPGGAGVLGGGLKGFAGGLLQLHAGDLVADGGVGDAAVLADSAALVGVGDPGDL